MGDSFPHQYEVLYKKALADNALAWHGFDSHDDNIDSATLHFHLQQAVEKCMKCLLSFNNVHFDKTHDLKALSKMCADNNVRLPPYIDTLNELNPYAVFGRYDFFEDSNADFEGNYALVKRFIEFVKGALSK